MYRHFALVCFAGLVLSRAAVRGSFIKKVSYSNFF